MIDQDPALEGLAKEYLSQRKAADAAYKNHQGGHAAGHAAMAHWALVEYATAAGVSTDEAARRIRRAA